MSVLQPEERGKPYTGRNEAMSDLRPTTPVAPLTKKQQMRRYALGCGLGLLPLFLGLLSMFFTCNPFFYFFASPVYFFFFFLVEVLTVFSCLWFPGVRSFGLGIFTSVVVLIFVFFFVFSFWWVHCGHFV